MHRRPLLVAVHGHLLRWLTFALKEEFESYVILDKRNVTANSKRKTSLETRDLFRAKYFVFQPFFLKQLSTRQNDFIGIIHKIKYGKCSHFSMNNVKDSVAYY